MKILQILGLILGLAIWGNAQNAVLSGTVYDANGAVIVGAKVNAVTLINEKLQKFEAETNDEGLYQLKLPFNQYDSKNASNFRVAKYIITVESGGFEKFVLKGFNFVPSYSGKMLMDVGLDVADTENCGVGGVCPPKPNLIEPQSSKFANEITLKPLAELPKAQNKTKRKTKIINKQ